MNIVPVRAFRDNYIWLLTRGRYTVAVDPGDAGPVLEYLQHHEQLLCGILVTHRHDDHVGGVEALLAHRQVPVYAPQGENFRFSYQPVVESDVVHLPELETSLSVLDVPGHTARHVAYYGGNSLFCGDTLFGCGCGRIFDGTCAQLYQSLQKIAALPDTTNIYCAHEYTLANISFALTVDPGNPALIERHRIDQNLINQGLPTLPSTLALEKATNPFLRTSAPPVQKSALKFDPNAINPEQIFCAIRAMKNLY